MVMVMVMVMVVCRAQGSVTMLRTLGLHRGINRAVVYIIEVHHS